jgi:hypothetical protein
MKSGTNKQDNNGDKNGNKPDKIEKQAVLLHLCPNRREIQEKD